MDITHQQKSATVKYRVNSEVKFYFAGSYHVGVVIGTKLIDNRLRYSILTDDGTYYPVAEDKIIEKL